MIGLERGKLLRVIKEQAGACSRKIKVSFSIIVAEAAAKVSNLQS
jgi:hypothetical protein